MVAVGTMKRLNVFFYRFRWWFSAGFLVFVLAAFLIKGAKDSTFIEGANEELRQLFSERQGRLGGFLETNEHNLQILLEASEFKKNIEHLTLTEPLEREKSIEALREAFLYHRKEVQYKNAFILSAEGELLFELENKDAVPFQPLNKPATENQSEKELTLKSVFERVRMTLAPAYSEFGWMQVVNASWLSFLRPSKFPKGY